MAEEGEADGFVWGSDPLTDDEEEGKGKGKVDLPAPVVVPSVEGESKKSTGKLTLETTPVAPKNLTGKALAVSSGNVSFRQDPGQPSRKLEEPSALVNVPLASLPPGIVSMVSPWKSGEEVSQWVSSTDPEPPEEAPPPPKPEERRRQSSRKGGRHAHEGSTAFNLGDALEEAPRPLRQRRRSSQVSPSEIRGWHPPIASSTKKTQLSDRPVRDPSFVTSLPGG